MKTQIQTKKIFIKLMIAALSLIIIVTMTVSVSYAWITLSKNPSVSGAQIAISGGNTILLAPDITAAGENGATVHYPGTFSESLAFSSSSYDYLSNLSGLKPISTADGIYWIVPSVTSGSYVVDDKLDYANLTTSGHNGNGSYIYLDFWVVSPGSEYYLRVSTDVGGNYRGSVGGNSNQGSSLVDIPKVTADGSTASGYKLVDTNGKISSSVRVGFLVNSDTAKDEDVLEYSRSEGYEERYRTLTGKYQERGAAPDAFTTNRFTIYEPDGTRHTAAGAAQGSYVETRPFSYNPYTHTVTETDISGILTVQKSSRWVDNIDQYFQTAVSGKNVAEENAVPYFLENYLQWQVTPYITSGEFFTNTTTLYANMSDGVVNKELVDSSSIAKSGATDDVYITMLERNTPQRIRMFIWIEGQDIDCADSNSEQSSFILNLELAGANN